MKTLTKEEVSKAVAEAMVKAMENIDYSFGKNGSDKWSESDFEPVYGYGITVRYEKEGDTNNETLIFKLHKYDGAYNKLADISINLTVWREMAELSAYGRVTPVADFLATFIGEVEVEED